MSSNSKFVMGGTPIWESPPFTDLMLDPFTDTTDGKGTFVKAGDFLIHILQSIPTQCSSWLQQIGGEANIQIIVSLIQGLLIFSSSLPSRSRNEDKLFEFLSELKNKIAMMTKGSFLLLPGGWSDDTGDYVLLYVLQRKEDCFAFGVCNSSGVGIEYHPVSADSPFDMKYKMSVVIDDIPGNRILDSAFWFMLFRMQVWPSPNNSAQLLYETLLPFLSGRPLPASVCECADGTTATTPWQHLPRAGDSSLAILLLEGIMLVLARKGLSERHGSYVSLLIRWQLCLMVYHDVCAVPKLTEAERITVRNVVKQTAIFAVKETRTSEGAVITSAQLTQVLNFLTEMEKRLATIAANDGPPPLNLKDTQFSPYPMFDGFVREENVERYAGPAELPPMFRPVELTLVTDRVTDYNQLTTALRHAGNVSYFHHTISQCFI